MSAVLPTLFSTLLPTLLGLLLHSTGLLLLGLLTLGLARHQSPAVQSLIGRATLAALWLTLLAAPFASRITPVWRLPLPEPAPAQVSALALPHRGVPAGQAVPLPNWNEQARGTTATQEPTPLLRTAPPETGEGGGSEKEAPAALLASSSNSSSSRFGGSTRAAGEVGLWPLGTLALLGWLGVCRWHLTRLRRAAFPLTTGPAAEMLAALTPRPPLLLVHPTVHSPFLAGLRRPAIFLPPGHEADFATDALRAIFVHELAHRDRRDNAWTLAARLLCALLWPQPLLWLLCRRLEQIGEDACDAAVLAHACPPRAYADFLLTLAARPPLGHRERALGAGVAPFRSSLGRRIQRILAKGTPPMTEVSPRLRLTIAALTAATALGSLFLVSSVPAQAPAPLVIALTPEQQQSRALVTKNLANINTIGIAIAQYAQNNKEHFPHAEHWMDEIGPYLKDKNVFFDPFQPSARRYGYAFNRNCSGKPLAAFAKPAEIISVFDSTLGARNANDTGQSLRYNIVNAHRYIGIGFVDGHVKWRNVQARPSFSIRGNQSWLNNPPPGYYSRRKAGQAKGDPQIDRLLADTLARSKYLARFAANHPDPELSNARFLAGLTPVQGPGVVVTLTDSRNKMPAMPQKLSSPNIIHDSDINPVVNELKAAGAEAVAVNDQRIVATSSVRCIGPNIFVNGISLTPPFVIKAIGKPKALAASVNLPGGVAAQLKMSDPAMFSVREDMELTLPAYSGGSRPHYARPAQAGQSAGTGQQVSASAEAGSQQALRQQRDQLQQQKDVLSRQIAALKATAPTGQAQPETSAKDPFSSSSLAEIERRIIARKLAQARVDIIDKKAEYGYTPQHPEIVAAQAKVRLLQNAYSHLLQEKQQFPAQGRVHRQRQVALLDEASVRERKLYAAQIQRVLIQADIARLQVQIDAAKARGSLRSRSKPNH